MSQTEPLVLANPSEPVSMELFTLLRDQAAMLIKTGFLPAHLKTPEQAVAVVLIGRELQVPMMQAIRKIFVINGTPALASELMLALAERTNEVEDLRIEDDGTTCVVTCKRKGRKTPVTTSFSMKDAEAMTLATRDNWKKQPAVMRRWRAISANLRLTFPDAIGGMYSVEELAPEVSVDATGTPLTPPPSASESVNPMLPRRLGEVDATRPESTPEPPRQPAATWDELVDVMFREAASGPGASHEAESARQEPKAESGSSSRPLGGSEPRPAPAGGTRFELNGQEIVTAGITKDTLLKAYKLSAQLDQLTGKGAAKDLLGREFGLEHRRELTELAGQRYVAELAKRVNRALGAAKR